MIKEPKTIDLSSFLSHYSKYRKIKTVKIGSKNASSCKFLSTKRFGYWEGNMCSSQLFGASVLFAYSGANFEGQPFGYRLFHALFAFSFLLFSLFSLSALLVCGREINILLKNAFERSEVPESCKFLYDPIGDNVNGMAESEHINLDGLFNRFNKAESPVHIIFAIFLLSPTVFLCETSYAYTLTQRQCGTCNSTMYV